jgi:hypothetical protein
MPFQSEEFVVFRLPMPVLTEVRETHKLDLAAEVLSSNGVIRLRTLGTSMLPSIWPGDVLNIENKVGEEIVPGNIALVRRDGRFFVHRLVESCNSQWITRGDSLPQNDPPVLEAQVLGKVSTIHRMSRVIVPSSRVTPLVRVLAWMFCHWDIFRNLVMRFHSFWLRHPSAIHTFDTNDAYLPACGE